MTIYTDTYDTPGEYEVTLPDGATAAHLEASGAGGGSVSGSDPGGAGGYASGDLPSPAGQTLTMRVGGAGGDETSGTGGYNGGADGAPHTASGADFGGGGGGASDIRIGGTTLSDRVLVAGGGGGGGTLSAIDSTGGAGGGLDGENGSGSIGGGGGSQSSGGSAGDFSASAGSFGDGGSGGAGSDTDAGGGAGGGGGWYGGGGGDAATDGGHGGGGGSSYIDSVDNGSTTTGDGATADTDGSVILEITAELDAPSDLSVTAERDSEIDLSWSAATGDYDGYRIYRDTTAGVDASSTEIADVSASATSYTDSGIDNGTNYYYVLEAYRAGDYPDTDLSNEAAGTTTLPDIASFDAIDATVEDELTISWTDAGLNAGRYRLRWKESDTSSYDSADQATVAYDASPLEYTITGLLDGEKYDVGIRTETDDVTGSWVTAAEITKLVPASGITFSGVAETSIDSVSWTIESDNFEGEQELWWQRTDYQYSDPKGVLLATVSSTTSSYSSLQVHPEREYKLTLRTQTDYVLADSTQTVTTDSAGLVQSAVPPQGWHVEVDHPSGTTLTPQVLDDAQLEPRLKDQPRAQIPVPRSETWLSESLEGATMRVWKDGDRQPIDEIEDVDIQTDRTVLVGTGGTELEQTVDRDVVAEPAHQVAADLVGDETGYVVNVDAPPVEESEAVAQDPATASEWTDVTEHSDLSEIPVGIDESADAPVTQRSNILLRTGDQQWDGIGGTGASTFSDSAYASGTGIGLQDQGDYVRWTFSLESTIAEDNVRFALRAESDSDVPPLTATITDTDSGDTVGSVSLWSNSSSLSLQWYSHENFVDGATVFASSSASEWDAGDLPAGNYELRLEAGTTYGDQGELRVDLLAVHDDRYQYNFGDSVDASGGIDGPAPYPHLVETRLDQYQAVLSVYGGDLSIDANDTGGEQFIEISNDGINWLRADNSSTVSGEFTDLGGSIMVRLGFSRHGDDGAGAVPRYGTEPTQINSLTLTAWLNDTPLVIGRNLKGDLSEVLTTQIADNVDALWEVRQDGDRTTFEWAQAGTRSSDRDADVVDYSVTKHNRRYLKATVEGGRSTVSDEAVTASYGSPVVLEEGRVIGGSERVRSADTGERYRTGLDYELRPGAGELDIREAGAIADDEALLVDYEHNVIGEWEHPDYDGDTRSHLTETIPNATTSRACTRAAKVLVDELSVPRWEADVSIPPGDAIDGLLEALDLEEVPGDALAVYENDVTPEGQQLRLGNRQQVSETVRRIQSQLAATSDRV